MSELVNLLSTAESKRSFHVVSLQLRWIHTGLAGGSPGKAGTGRVGQTGEAGTLTPTEKSESKRAGHIKNMSRFRSRLAPTPGIFRLGF